MFREVAPDLYVLSEGLSFYGLQIGRNMVVIRLPDGNLFINSPAALTEDRAAALNRLGTVRYVTPSSKLHGHLHMEKYVDAFPEVELFAAPELDRRRTDLAFDGLLGSSADERWGEVIDQEAFMGHRWLTEIEFFHRPSNTLILGDVCYNLGPQTPVKTELFARLLGMYGDLSVPPDLRYTIKKRAGSTEVSRTAARVGVRTRHRWSRPNCGTEGEATSAGGVRLALLRRCSIPCAPCSTSLSSGATAHTRYLAHRF